MFDLVSLISFLAVAGSLRFDSPKLDLIALVSLVFFATRTFFRYSNKYARYDLLVNKFLTQKISHRGPGALKYIVSEANSQRALRAMLIRDWLYQRGEAGKSGGKQGGEKTYLDEAILELGKSYVNQMASADAARVDVDILSALSDLKYLGLIKQISEKQNGGIDDHSFNYELQTEPEALETITRLWNELLIG